MRSLIGFLERFIFEHRLRVLVIFGVISVFMFFQASRLRIDAGFEKLLPLDHGYVETFLEHQAEFGGANRLLIAVRAKQGDIFTPEFFKTLKAVTDEVFFLPGVNKSTVRSVFTPNVRFIEIVEGGFAGGNVVPADFSPTPESLERVKENILKAGIMGRLVANDLTAAMVTAQLVEIDPTTGEKLDYLKVARLLETNIRDAFVSDAVDIHIVGFAKTLGDIADGASEVVLFFFLALAITTILVYFITRSKRLTVLPLLTSLIAVIWTLGLLHTLGYGIDPMSLLVPFLIFAIGVSHGVQMVNAYAEESRRGDAPVAAARRAFNRLITAGSVGLISDAVGFLTLMVINIRIIQELAITASLGVVVIILTNLILLPRLLAHVSMGPMYQDRLARTESYRRWIWNGLGRFAERRYAVPVLVLALVLGGLGYRESQKLQIGDTHAGVPELRTDSRYNQDTAMITGKFSIGLDILTTIVETVPNGCIDHEVMETIDRFAWHLANVPGVQSTISLPQVVKIINAGWNEGNPKWRILPRNQQTMAQSSSQVETGTGLLNSDCSVIPVIAFLKDHKAETIARVTDTVEAFALANNSENHTFRLATGNVGVMAATNEVVSRVQFRMLLYIYAAVAILCLAAFRSIRATLCIILPLTLVSILAYALMAILGIGLKTYTLPVAALGVGIGVDYGIYIFSRLRQFMGEGMPLKEAYEMTLRVTGSAVIVTGLTLAAGVSTWVFSDLRFQADMGMLLAFMFLANMLAAAFLLPALATLIMPKVNRS